jgi:hypothetical protein
MWACADDNLKYGISTRTIDDRLCEAGSEAENKQGTGRRGLSLLCFYFGCSLRRPVTVPSLVHAPGGGRTGIPGHSQPERKRTSFRAVNPPSSRASRIRAGVEPRHHARVVRSRPEGIPRRADIAGGPACSHPRPILQCEFRALASRGGTSGSMGDAERAGIRFFVGDLRGELSGRRLMRRALSVILERVSNAIPFGDQA